MRTILTKEIDGYQVVKGIGYPALDPVSTRTAVKPLLDDCEESICCLNKQKVSKEIINRAWQTARVKRKAMYNQNMPAWKAGMIALKQTQEYITYTNLLAQLPVVVDRTDEENQTVVDAEKVLLQKKDELVMEINQAFFKMDEYQNFISLRDSERESVRESTAALAQKRLELTRNNAVYFTPRAGEVIISEAEGADCVTQLSALSVATVLTRDPKTTVLTVIADLRGTEYWDIQNNRWQKNKITVLNEDIPTGGILTIDLTADNRTEIVEEAEEDRVAALSTAEKQTEYDAAVVSLTAEMVNYRSGLEIGGAESADALTQTQDLFETEDEKLKSKYGII